MSDEKTEVLSAEFTAAADRLAELLADAAKSDDGIPDMAPMYVMGTFERCADEILHALQGMLQLYRVYTYLYGKHPDSEKIMKAFGATLAISISEIVPGAYDSIVTKEADMMSEWQATQEDLRKVWSEVRKEYPDDEGKRVAAYGKGISEYFKQKHGKPDKTEITDDAIQELADNLGIKPDDIRNIINGNAGNN